MITEELAKEVEESSKQPEENLPYFAIREYPDEALRKVCLPYLEPIVGCSLQPLLDVMEKTMLGYGLAGLAGSQVGIFYQVVCINVDGKALTMINPIITEASTSRSKENEACASFRGLVLKVERAGAVKAKWTNRQGEIQEQWFYGQQARAVQHELDHCNGIVFLSKISLFQRRGAMDKMRIAQRRAKSLQGQLKSAQKSLSKIQAVHK